MLEDLLDRGALGQEGEHRHAAAAAFAVQHVEAEDPLEQLRPRNPGRPFMAAGAAVREGTVAAGALEACGAAGSRDGTTSLRQAALGANTPCYAHLETMLSHSGGTAARAVAHSA